MTNEFEMVSEQAQQLLSDAAMTKADLALFSIADLKSEFKLTLREIVALRRDSSVGDSLKRGRDNDSESGNEDAEVRPEVKLAGLASDVFGTKDILPSKWVSEVSLRTLINAGPARRLENQHIRQELDFLILLAGNLIVAPESVKILCWGRIMQLILKHNFPQIGLSIPTIWNAHLAKLKKYDDVSLIMLVNGVAKELEVKNPPAPPQAQNVKTRPLGKIPPFRPFRPRTQ